MYLYFKLIISFVLVTISFSSCDNNTENNHNTNISNTDSSIAILNKKLSIEDYDFAILENREFIQYNKAIYHRGDEIYFVLKNVGSFIRGTDSLHKAEMKLEVFDAIGQLITIRNNLFGNSGHTDIKNNILKEPYASYSSSKDDKIGKYTIKVTVYDLIKGDSVSISDDFFLE